MSDIAIREMQAADWPAVQTVFAMGIATGNATFETRPPETWETFAAGKHRDLRIVAVDGSERVVGWATASPVSPRPAYRGVLEDSVYVHPDASGRGIGGLLLAELISRANRAGIWTLQCSIFPENTASIRLHERNGFRIIGIRERIARMSEGPETGRWRDTVLLERRAPST